MLKEVGFFEAAVTLPQASLLPYLTFPPANGALPFMACCNLL